MLGFRCSGWPRLCADEFLMLVLKGRTAVFTADGLFQSGQAVTDDISCKPMRSDVCGGLMT